MGPMGKDRGFLGFSRKSASDWASKFWPVGHVRFEEMCALAITGQLGGAQMCELDEHIASCERCRHYLESVAQVSVQVMPLLAEKHAPDRKLTPPAGMRERFVERLRSERVAGANAPQLRPFSLKNALAKERPAFETLIVHDRATERRSPKRISSLSFWRPLAIGSACVIAIAAAYYAGTRRTAQAPTEATGTSTVHSEPAPAVGVLGNSSEPDRVSDLEWQKSELEAKLDSMRQELASAQSDRESLNKELLAAKAKLAALTEEVSARPAQNTPLAAEQQSQEQIAGLQAQVARLNQRLAESELNLGIQKQTSEDLNAKLEQTSFDLQRERDLKSAKSEMGDLAGSRNLHIVDVYDADPSGKRQRSFGRVFYIEGQSLVFYAYDLDDPGQFRANVLFHVWGGKAGVKEVTHSLGILHKDDSQQNRWAMTFDDPNVLSQINSVFVTAESASKRYDSPHGRKVLYAYFGGPANHP